MNLIHRVYCRSRIWRAHVRALLPWALDGMSLERSAVLEFAATIDGKYVNGIDMIHWNDAGQITSVKVMVRPLKGLQALVPKMAELLAQA